MQELICGACETTVLVEKFSPSHTSIQWLDDAKHACPEFARFAAAGENVNAIPTCPALRETIEEAARSGRLATDSRRVEPTRGLPHPHRPDPTTPGE
ncbi:hypothetical protein GTV32_11685 [Gordonia sp. SID5947]|uniref:hypothetical protein n=1 Tax=Gordonia sp. SID5947 TaxID=2690315 RepID=UPI00136E81D6|nr:hypothetical protein [Gordonia sp. SID5947]MYR06923.1 hypothetical protein [Gordonia sp. SID5947]